MTENEKIAKMLIGVSSDFLAGNIEIDVLRMQVNFANESLNKESLNKESKN
jgi:hypothetical protein